MPTKRKINTDATPEDVRLDHSLRPRYLTEYIGQEKTKSNLKVYIDAAKFRGDTLDHVLFYGPPGLGKTTLAGIIANEMGTNLKVTSGPAIEKPGEMAAILNNLETGDILFVDEIHRLNRQVEEVLYPAMEDFGIDIIIGKGAASRSIRLDLPHFTLVGATTRPGMLTAPLRDRFGVIDHLEYYTPGELYEIIIRSADLLDVEIDIFDLSGRLLWNYTESGVSTGNTYTVDWDLCVDGGRRLQTGVYLYRVRISSDGSSQASQAKKLIVMQ